jgi:hypothetical protein
MITENVRQQTAKTCAGEAVEALYSVYWSDSFDAEGLEARLAEVILSFTRSAQSLAKPHPNPEQLELLGQPVTTAPCLPLAQVQVGGQ